MASSLPKCINLLLIGKTGNGKSALGNSILRRDYFKSVSSTTSVTISIEQDVTQFDGREIRVVDGPGVGDTRVDNEVATELILTTTSHAMSENPEGFHALLLVVRLGRFTKEDWATVEFLKKVFGQNSVKKHCILVITCGDNFERDGEDGAENFEDWCAAQTGVFQDLLNECGHRVVLFDNKTKDEKKKDRQLRDMLQVVDRLDNVYSDDDFTKAIKEHEQLLIEARKQAIIDDTQPEINKVRRQLNNFQFISTRVDQIDRLDEIYKQAVEVSELVIAKDAGTGVLQDVIKDVQLLQSEVQAKYCLIQITS